MKNNKEFLKEVYKKAEILEKEKENKPSYSNWIKYSSLAALLILIPILGIMAKNWTSKPTGIETRLANVSVDDSMEYLLVGDYIVVGEIENIYKKNKDSGFVRAEISVREILKGNISEESLALDLVAESGKALKKGKTTLFVLNKENGRYRLHNELESLFIESKKDVFQDYYGNNYPLEEIKRAIEGEN